MRQLGLIIVAAAVILIATTWFVRTRGTSATPTDIFPSTEIRITGASNSLASVAEAVNDPRRITYDPLLRKAVVYADLVIEGELQLGRENDRASGETLELATQVCGDLRIVVPPGGTLRLYHSILTTQSQIVSVGACTRGYGMFVDGSLHMLDSQIKYISGSRSELLRGQAEASIRKSIFSYCDGNAFSLVDVDGGRIIVDECDFLSSGNWGVVVRGSGGDPVDLRNCLLKGLLGAVLVTGDSARARLIDCVLSQGGIVFNGPSGEVTIAWSRRVKVVDAENRSPQAGILVTAESDLTSPVSFEAEAVTNEQGVAELIITDWVASPFATSRIKEQNTVGTVHIFAASPDGRRGPATVISVNGKVPKSTQPIVLTTLPLDAAISGVNFKENG